jgi:hypothetical protein
MTCSSCGKKKKTVSSQQAQKIASGSTSTTSTNGRPQYTVTEPSGKTQQFNSYIEASRYKRKTKGTLSTST